MRKLNRQQDRINLWFCGQLTWHDLCRDWSQHNKHSWDISSVHSFPGCTVNIVQISFSGHTFMKMVNWRPSLMPDTCDCILRDRIAICLKNIDFVIPYSQYENYYINYHNPSIIFLRRFWLVNWLKQPTLTKLGRLLPTSVNNFYHTTRKFTYLQYPVKLNSPSGTKSKKALRIDFFTDTAAILN